MKRDDRLMALEVDIDTRLADLWSSLWESRLDKASAQLAVSLRISYALGYRDSLRETREGQEGKLEEDTGTLLA